MKWIKRNKNKEKANWHAWFAWHPVNVGSTPDGDPIYIWLNNILRCGTWDSWDSVWEYKYKEVNNG